MKTGIGATLGLLVIAGQGYLLAEKVDRLEATMSAWSASPQCEWVTRYIEEKDRQDGRH